MNTIYSVLKEAADESAIEAGKEADEYVRLIAIGAPSHAEPHATRGQKLLTRAHAIEQALAELPREVAERGIE